MIKNKFTKALLIAATVSISFSANALPATLKDTMKSMSSLLKTIASQVSNPQLNESSAIAADDFVALSEHSKTFVPHKVEQMPTNDQAAQMQEYGKSLDGGIKLGKELAASLRANDNTRAKEIVAKLSDVKKDGHSKFK